MNIRGELSKIPKVVVGAHRQTIKELSRLWLERDNRSLAKHPIQFQILEEVLLQLETFRSYAQQIGQPALTDIYNKMHRLLDEIYQSKKSLGIDSGKRDSVFYNLQDNLKIAFM